MANKITPDQIAQMQTLYASLKTYSAVAKQMGISPATVSRYLKAANTVKTYSSGIEPIPMQDIPSNSISSWGIMTEEEHASYTKWLKEFGR